MNALKGIAARRRVWTAVALSCALALAAFGIGYAGKGPREAPTFVTPGVHPHRVIAYYFHTTYRCASCRAIEAYSREALQAAFTNELRDGRVVWKVVNIETKGNEHFAKDYRLYTKSLVLVNEARGRRTEWKNLEKVWQLLQDKPAFLRYVQDETRAYLAKPV
jgi:hypothetical protein